MYMLTNEEKADLCAFVDLLARVGKIKMDVLEKIQEDRLTKRDLSTIQRKIDLFVGSTFSSEFLSVTNPFDLYEIQSLAAKAHRALRVHRVYDWK